MGVSVTYADWLWWATVSVANPSAQEGYQALVSVAYVAGKMNADFSDIRFTDEDDNALYHALVAKTDSSTATFRVKLPADCAAYRIFCGKADATSASDPANTYEQHDAFTRANSATVGGGWTEDEASGAACTVDANRLKVVANAHSYGHVEKAAPALANLVIEGRIQYTGALVADSWGPGLYAYWAAGSYAGTKLRSLSGVKHATTMMVAGTETPTNGAAASAGTWYWHRLTVTSTQVIAEWSADAVSWTQIAATARPAQFSGAPSLVIVGKGYGSGSAPYANPDMDNSYSSPGTAETCYWDEVFVRKAEATEPTSTIGSYTTQTVPSDLQGLYHIQEPVASDLEGLYDIMCPVASDLEGRYDIRIPPPDLEGRYDIRRTQDLEGLYDIRIAADLEGKMKIIIAADLEG